MRQRSPAAWLMFFLPLLFITSWPSQADAQWTALTNAPAEFLDNCNLLTDGTVDLPRLQHQPLAPADARTSTAATRTARGPSIANMPNGVDTNFGCNPCTYAPLYFAYAVLADGRLVVIGGEYNTPGGAV